MVTGQQQCVLGAGERHVQQSAFLVDTALIEPALVLGYLVRQAVSDRSRPRCRAPGRRVGPAVARSPRSSGGRLGSVGEPGAASTPLTETLGRSGAARPPPATPGPLAACTVRICTRSCATVTPRRFAGWSPPRGPAVLHRCGGIQERQQVGTAAAAARGAHSRPPRRRTRRGVRYHSSRRRRPRGLTSASTPSTRRTSATSSGSG